MSDRAHMAHDQVMTPKMEEQVSAIKAKIAFRKLFAVIRLQIFSNNERVLAVIREIRESERSKKITVDDCVKYFTDIFRFADNALPSSISRDFQLVVGPVISQGALSYYDFIHIINYVTCKDKPVSALVIVDVQNDFINGSLGLKFCPAKEEAIEVVPVINSLRTLPFDVIVQSQDFHPADHCSFITNYERMKLDPSSIQKPKVFDVVKLVSGVEQTIWPVHCVEGTWGSEFEASLYVSPTDIIVKKGTNPDVDSYSAFWDNAKLSKTALSPLLQAIGVRETYICGIAYDVCVSATAVHSVELGYQTTMITDACRGVSQEGMETTRKTLTNLQCRMITSEKVQRDFA